MSFFCFTGFVLFCFFLRALNSITSIYSGHSLDSFLSLPMNLAVKYSIFNLYTDSNK